LTCPASYTIVYLQSRYRFIMNSDNCTSAAQLASICECDGIAADHTAF
jgi:hypothetical protein